MRDIDTQTAAQKYLQGRGVNRAKAKGMIAELVKTDSVKDGCRKKLRRRDVDTAFNAYIESQRTSVRVVLSKANLRALGI